jgi:hypothetical protein
VATITPTLGTLKGKTEEWAKELIDLGARNTLLSFKLTKSTTLDLNDADPIPFSALLRGETCRLRRLFLDHERHRRATAQAKSVRRRILQLEEEQGLDPGRLALGVLATERTRTAGAGLVFPLRATARRRAGRTAPGLVTAAPGEGSASIASGMSDGFPTRRRRWSGCWASSCIVKRMRRVAVSFPAPATMLA